MEENKEIEIDLKKTFLMLKKKAIIIVIIAFIGAALAGSFTKFFITPQYTAAVKMYAWSNSDNIIGSTGSISRNDYETSQMLVNTYLEVINSDTLAEKVANELGNRLTAAEIKSMMSCSQVQDTIAFQISVTSPDPEEAKEIVNIIADTCPDVIVKVLKVGGVEVIDYAKTPTHPSSPNLKKNLVIGFMAGFAISFVIFFIKELFDTSINDEEDLKKEFDIPIIGTVPRLLPVTEKNKAEDTAEHLAPPQPAIAHDRKEDK
ncbi:MAG: Wzz/FepE/Etk N-terminal domain-containing protein [Clostridium sp.]|nr:Wzz/FepE/Etk N-terminal domain-containing protein [Clostridium sp.]